MTHDGNLARPANGGSAEKHIASGPSKSNFSGLGSEAAVYLSSPQPRGGGYSGFKFAMPAQSHSESFAPQARSSSDASVNISHSQSLSRSPFSKPSLDKSSAAPAKISGSGSERVSKLIIPPIGDLGSGQKQNTQPEDESNENKKPPELPSEKEGAGPALSFDARKSIKELLELKDGSKFRASGSPADPADPDRIADKLAQGEKAKISLVFADQENQNLKPDFLIKRDGSIEVVNNPENNPDKNIVIVVEGDDTEATAGAGEFDSRQASIDALTKYMTERIAQNPDYQNLGAAEVELEDPHKLISDAAIAKPPEAKPADIEVPEVPPGIQDISDQMNGIRQNGGSGSFPREQIDGAGGDRQVPPPPDELPPVQAMKETLAAMFKPDEKEPYWTVRKGSDGYRVGRYGTNGRNAGNWLSMMLALDPELAAILGDPPDYSKLQEYLKKHPEKAKALQSKMAEAMKKGMKDLGDGDKIPKDFAAKFDDPEFASKFADFMGKLSDPNASEAEIKDGMKTFMPKKLQETMNQQLVEHYARQIVGDKNPDHMTPEEAGKVGLAFALGRVPTAEDLKNPSYAKYQEASQNFYQLARAGQFGWGDIDVSEHNKKLVATARGNVGEALWAQTPWSGIVEGGNLGCAASVSRALQEAGVRVPGSAGVLELASQLRRAGYQQVPISSMSQYRPGDIVYGSVGSGSGGNAHIGIIGEVVNGQVWQYDNSSSTGKWTHQTVQGGGSFVPGGRFPRGNLFVLRKPGAEAST